MSMNGSGVYVVNSAGQPVVAATFITATAFNAFTADVATALSTAIMKDGQTTITQNIPFNAKKITGLGAGTARTDAASLATIQDGTGVYVGTVGGTFDEITLTPSPAITAYAAGQTFRFKAGGVNTTNVTVAVSGLTAKAVTKHGTAALVAGDITSGAMVHITYDGTRFILVADALPYETITWTPSVGGDATYTTQEGTGTKVGRMATISCALTINTIGTGSTINITGIPYNPATGNMAYTASVWWDTAATSVINVTAVLPSGTATITLMSITAAAASLNSSQPIFQNGTNVRFSMTYETA